jgi:hypothetical protein
MNDFPEFDDLPDDPEVAFVRLFEKFEGNLQHKVELERDDNRLHYAEYMNSIIGVARGLGIEGFDTWEIPNDIDDIYAAYVSFDRAVKRFVMEVKVRKSRVTKVYSVELTAEDKGQIHAYIAKIREVIEGADLEERKRNSLFAKLNAFEADIDRRRTRFDNAMLFTLEIIGAVDKGTQTLNPISEIMRRIEGIMGKRKAGEPEQSQLPGPTEPKKLESPPKRIEHKPSQSMGDEIPF